jgi:hypothetical protein
MEASIMEALHGARAGREMVLAIAGPLDDAILARVLAMEATPEELLEAAAWAAQESDVMGEERKPMTARVAQLYDLITAEEPEREDEAPR